MAKAKLAKKAKKAPKKTIIPGIPDVVIYVAGGVILLAIVIALMVIQPPRPPATATPTAEQAARPLANVPPAGRDNYYTVPSEMSIDPTKTYRATIVTDKGDIVVDLNAEKAPQTVNNFVFLARQGFYDGLIFHRVEPGFVIQGGDPQGTGAGGPGYTVPAEIDLKHTDGAIAMARRGDNVNPERASSGSQFYITLGPQPGLDDQYTVFGQVVEGLEVTRRIQRDDVIRRIDVSEQ